MDDEALACGGLIAKLPQKERIHIVYATDGMKSPAPIMAGGMKFHLTWAKYACKNRWRR
jgi:hypothetical protein